MDEQNAFLFTMMILTHSRSPTGYNDAQVCASPLGYTAKCEGAALPMYTAQRRRYLLKQSEKAMV